MSETHAGDLPLEERRPRPVQEPAKLVQQALRRVESTAAHEERSKRNRELHAVEDKPSPERKSR